MGCCFETTSAKLAMADLDPTKHVNYVLGMVLGEDDFKQEFAYLAGRDQWLARDLIGYGTARGLSLHVDMDASKGPRIYIDPGVAVSPRGQLICVPSPQCAYLRDWVAKNATEVSRRAGSPVATLPIYIVLCYRACPDDDVPIPGEPCRTEDQLTAPSRLRDDFCLELTFEPPKQREEEALRDFCQWLRAIDMSDASLPSSPLQDFLDAIRHAVAPWFSSPPISSPPADYMFGSPPSGLHVHPDDVCDYLRAAFRVWVTELRPKWIERWYGCAPNSEEAAPAEECVLIGEIRVTLISDGAGGLTPDDLALPTVHEDKRPFVVHLRMLQEWLLCGGRIGGAAPVTGPPSGPILAAGTSVQSETAFGLGASAGISAAYSRADHTHGTPTLPDLVGDAGGAIGSNTVNRVRGIDVVTTGASSGQFLGFNGTAWVPTAAPAAPTGRFVERGAAQAYTIVAAGSVEFPITLGTGGAPPSLTTATMLTSYNGLAVAGTYDPAAGGFRFTFSGFRIGSLYIVKLTPWAQKGSGSANPFFAYFSDFVNRVGTGPTALPAGFTVTVALNPAPAITAGRLMIEVSQIG